VARKTFASQSARAAGTPLGRLVLDLSSALAPPLSSNSHSILVSGHLFRVWTLTPTSPWPLNRCSDT
jgi:hypothetical protein